MKQVFSLDDIRDLESYFDQNPQEARVKNTIQLHTRTLDRMYGDKKKVGTLLPWSNTHENVLLRPGELSIWAGVNGHGKSLLLSHVMLDAAMRGKISVTASMEMPPEATLERMVRQTCGTSTPPYELSAKILIDTLSDYIFVFDHIGTVRTRVILAVIRYCAEKLKPDHFVIDSLMKCGINADDYNGQKRFIDQLTAIAKDTGMHIHLVAHSRKRENEKGLMDKFDVKGTSEITDMADNVFTVWRNKEKENERKRPQPRSQILDGPDCILICDKQRHGEWEGKIGLTFHNPSFQYIQGERPIPYLDYGSERNLAINK
jgi:twinkle protein